MGLPEQDDTPSSQFWSSSVGGKVEGPTLGPDGP